jgi:hypothetical protein
MRAHLDSFTIADMVRMVAGPELAPVAGRVAN